MPSELPKNARMKSLLVVLLCCLSVFNTIGADIASVNFKGIKDELRAYYFAKAQNAEQKAKFEAAVQEEEKQMEELQKSLRSGNKPDFDTLAAKKFGVSRFELERKLNADLKQELYLLISGLGLKYELIYDSSDSEAIIFAKSQIDDITPTVKQAIIDAQKK